MTAETIRGQLTPALRDLAILSWSSYSFAGEAPVVTPPPAAGAPLPLAAGLMAGFYERCYTKPYPATAIAPGEPADADFAGALSAANQTKSRWDRNWRVYAVGANGQVSLQKGEFQRKAMPGEYLAAAPGMPPQVGATVNLWIAHESFQYQPGFYFVFSETPTDMWDEFDLLRYYFHTTAAGAPGLVRYWTTELNRLRLPFRLKTLSDPAGYTRTDAMVLYFARRYHAAAARLALEMPEDVTRHLRPAVPLFARALRPGVGIAEEPNTGESFGMHRCRLTAEGVLDAFAAGDQSVEGRLRAIEERFRSNGFDLERPHLSPGSADLAPVEEIEL